MNVILNPDSYFVSVLKKQIKDNGKYCLNKAKGNPDNKCPCKEFHDTGRCECGMYISFSEEDDYIAK